MQTNFYFLWRRLGSSGMAILVLLLLPLLGWGQTTIVNYDFLSPSGATFATAVGSPSLASGVTSTVTASGTTPITVSGIISGAGAFSANATAGGAITLSPFGTANYFQFQLGGTTLNTYSSYKVYFQAQRSNIGPAIVTLAYSTDGSTYTNFTPTGAPGNSSFVENFYDLSAITALNAKSNVYLRILPSGANAGTFRIDNFQVQATSTSPNLTPSATTLTGLNYVFGVTPSTSATSTFNLTGSNLTAGGGTITVTGSTNYDVSSDNITFANTASKTYTGTSLSSTAVYMRLKSDLRAGPYNGEIIAITGGGTATATNVTVSGYVSPAVTEVYVPQYAGATGSGTDGRVPYAFRLTFTGLKLGAPYSYTTQAVKTTDAINSTNAKGNAIYVTQSGSFVRSTGPAFTASNFGTFTADATGNYTGWFALETNSSTATFPAGVSIYPVIGLNDGSAGTSLVSLSPTISTVALLAYGTTVSSTLGTGVYGISAATAKNFVLSYDNQTGTGRPLYATFVESDGSANTTANSYASFYGTNVDAQAGRYGLLTPNSNSNGIQRLEQRALADGSLVCANTDVDGVWPSGVNTVNPTGGLTTPLVIAATDVPLAAPGSISVNLTSGSAGTTLIITGTNFMLGGTTVTIGGAAATITLLSSTSITTTVPAGAAIGLGQITINTTSTCNTQQTTAFTVTAPVPTIGVSGGPLTAFNAVAGSPSASQSLSVSGVNLSTDIVLTAPTGYEVSLSSGSGYGSSLTLPPISGTVAATLVYVRLTGTTTTAGLGTSLLIGSSGATSQNQPVSGTVVVEPTIIPTVVAGTPGSSTVILTLSGGNGSNYVVVMRPAASAAIAPTDATTYAANAAYGSGGITGTNNYVVLAASTTTTTVAVTGLGQGTHYAADVYAYNVGTAAGVENYLPTAGTTTFTTTIAPVALVTFTTAGTPSGTNLPVFAIATNVTATDGVRGSGFVRPNSAASNTYANSYTSTVPTSLANAISNNSYYSFSLTSASGYAASLSTIVLNAYRTSAGANNIELLYSTDGVNFPATNTLGSITVTTTATSYTFSTTSVGALQNAPGTLYFRVYGYGGTTGNLYLIDGSGKGMVVTGSVVPVSFSATPNTLALSTFTGQTATGSYTLNGSNLGANATVSVSSGSSSVLLSTGGAHSQTLTLTANAGGTLAQAISVQYIAPATAGTATVTIANNTGAFSAPVMVNTTSVSFATYTWTGTSSASYSDPNNWSPARSTVAATDVLTFDGSITAAPIVAVDFAGSQTIGQLRFVNNVNATLSTDATRSLTLDNNVPGDDFVVAVGSTLTVHNSNAAAISALNLLLTGSETGLVSGTLVFDGNPALTLGQHTLQATGTNAVQFVAGSVFRTTATYDGGITIKPFGATTANSIVFRNGSRYEQFGGSNPFGLTQPASVLTLEPTSYFYFAVLTGSPALTGRTYGTLELHSGANVLGSGASPTTIQGNLLVSSGTVSLTQTGGINLQGNVTVNGTATLNLAPATSGNVTLNGTTAQTIGGNSTAATPISVGANATLVVNNAAGITLAVNLPVTGTLNLTNGLLTTSATNLLTLASAATVTGGSSTSFVNGPLARGTSAGAATTVFPIGKGTAYRPLTLRATAQSAARTYTAEQFNSTARTTLLTGTGSGTVSATDALTRVSNIRFYTLAPVAVDGTFNGTVTLSFEADDFVNYPAEASFVMAKRANSASAWGNFGRSSSFGTANGGLPVVGTLTSDEFTTFSDFTLASTDASANNALNTKNPLPVQLTSFRAQRQTDKSVVVEWATASEKNSARFEVQRSLDGREFATIATVAAQGNGTRPTAYVASDKTAPAAMLYYRLRQVDQDGSFNFSPVVTVVGIGQLAKVLLYPNPTFSSLHFLAETALLYRVLNQLGQPLLHGIIEAGVATVPTETLKTGLYFIELQTTTGRVVQKFEKQ